MIMAEMPLMHGTTSRDVAFWWCRFRRQMTVLWSCVSGPAAAQVRTFR